MMRSEEDLDASILEMLEKYSDQLPSLTHEPKRFLYYVNLFKWNKELRKFQFTPGVVKNDGQ